MKLILTAKLECSAGSDLNLKHLEKKPIYRSYLGVLNSKDESI